MTNNLKEFFPFVCENRECQTVYEKPKFLEVINLNGMVYAESVDHIYLGLTCVRCNWTTVKPVPMNTQDLDLRNLIIMPDPFSRCEIAQQIIEYETRKNKRESLHFQYMPAWDHSADSYDLLKASFESRIRGLKTGNMEYSLSDDDDFEYDVPIPYLIPSTDRLELRRRVESQTGRIALRRLYPDVPRYRYLIQCLSPPPILEVHEYTGAPEDYINLPGDPDVEIVNNQFVLLRNGVQNKKQRNDWWIHLLELSASKSIKSSSINLLRSRGFKTFSEKRFDEILHSILLELHADETKRIRLLTSRIGFEKRIWGHLESVFQQVVNKVCTELSLDPERKSLSDWVNRIEEGKALLVDAPIGLGKTYSITGVLSERSDLSAVVFMPTLKMCEEVVERLKTKSTQKRGTYDKDRLNGNNVEWAKDEDGEVIIGRNDLPVYKWKREFLQSEVYFVDGINKNECINFSKIIKSYRERKGWKKQDYCKKCKKAWDSTCRFLKHEENTKKARIVVTTHAQYDKFYNKSDLHNWYKVEAERENTKTKVLKRNVFIVDEDLVLTNCYQPTAVEYKHLDAFVKDFCDFLSDFDRTAKIIEKIETFSGKVGRCEENTIIPPIDKKFSIPDELLDNWKEDLTVEYDLESQYLEKSNGKVDLSELLVHAIRVGTTVERFDQWNAPYGKRFRIHFANPKYYDLSKMPSHVFFDGTLLDKRFLKKKLKNVRLEKMKINLKQLWQLRVYQNIFTDLPKKTTLNDKPYVETFVRDLLRELQEKRTNHKYFFLMSKYTKEEYFEHFLNREFAELNRVLCHYRYMKGINDAKDCDIGIVLGSYVMPIAAEFAMALEFVQNQITKRGMNIRLNDTFSWPGINAKRRFKNDYEIVGKLGDSLRLSEHRQGIGRTRHIFHDVDLYVISKDLVGDYEELAVIVTDQLRTDLFSRKERSDSQYLKVRQDVEKWLVDYDYGRITDIRKVTGLGRRIVRKHLYRMVEEDLLRRAKEGREYRYYKMDTIP